MPSLSTSQKINCKNPPLDSAEDSWLPSGQISNMECANPAYRQNTGSNVLTSSAKRNMVFQKEIVPLPPPAAYDSLSVGALSPQDHSNNTFQAATDGADIHHVLSQLHALPANDRPQTMSFDEYLAVWDDRDPISTNYIAF